MPIPSVIDSAYVIVRALEERASSLWLGLPSNLRLQGRPETLQKRTYESLTRERMLNARLTYLQVLFLLHGGASDLGHRSPVVFEIAEEMLALIVWSILFRDRLVVSSTGIVWKVRAPSTKIVARLNLTRSRYRTTDSQPLASSRSLCYRCVRLLRRKPCRTTPFEI